MATTPRAAVLHINSARPDATTPTMRIARFVGDTLGLPVICNVETANKYDDRRFDTLFVKYGILKFSNHRDQALRIYSRAKRIINLENDYTFKPDPRFRKANPSYSVWGTVPANASANAGVHLNWNVLTWNYPRPWLPALPLRAASHEAYANSALLYYGAYRVGRIDAFNKYLKNAPYRVGIGTNPRNANKYRELDLFDMLKFRTNHEAVLRDYAAATLYIEDAFSRSNFCSLANRYYESLQAGVLVLIAEESRDTFREAGYPYKQIDNYVVGSQHDITTKLAIAHRLTALQRKQWYEDFVEPVRDALLTNYSALVRGVAITQYVPYL